ncbi:MAG: uracil-DNA glycosylase family protein [Myxococcota bacterium]
MSDVVRDFAALVADVLAHADALRSGGTEVVARGAAPGLPPADPRPPAPNVALPSWMEASPARPAAIPPNPAASPPPAVAAASPRPVVASPPPSAPPSPPAASTGGAGLFASSKWARVLTDPAERLDALAREVGERCADCGEPPPRGEGSARARLTVVADTMRGEAAVMFERMLVHVLLLERADVFVVPAPPCVTCRAHLAKLLDAVDPRVVLAMGRAGADAAGGWKGRVLPTFHPEDLVARPGDKKAAFEHLQEARRRLS